MSCVGDGKCMKLCKDINVCLINYDHEISSNYTRFCKTKCEHECKLIPCINNLHCKVNFHLISLHLFTFQTPIFI